MMKSETIKHHNLKKALQEATKTITIQISDEDLKNLKSSNYNLCFAKKVDGFDYNLVWQAYGNYLSTNVFSWTPQYQLFGTNNFTPGSVVSTQTNLMTIGLGESSTLDEFGLLSNPVSGGSIKSISMQNNYGIIYPGICQVSTGIDATIISTPIYIAQNALLKGVLSSLTPLNKVMVWFQQDIETATMFSSTTGSANVEIDLTTANTATRFYFNGVWSTV
jgi:hypothetical protein